MPTNSTSERLIAIPFPRPDEPNRQLRLKAFDALPTRVGDWRQLVDYGQRHELCVRFFPDRQIIVVSRRPRNDDGWQPLGIAFVGSRQLASDLAELLNLPDMSSTRIFDCWE